MNITTFLRFVAIFYLWLFGNFEIFWKCYLVDLFLMRFDRTIVIHHMITILICHLLQTYKLYDYDTFMNMIIWLETPLIIRAIGSLTNYRKNKRVILYIQLFARMFIRTPIFLMVLSDVWIYYPQWSVLPLSLMALDMYWGVLNLKALFG